MRVFLQPSLFLVVFIFSKSIFARSSFTMLVQTRLSIGDKHGVFRGGFSPDNMYVSKDCIPTKLGNLVNLDEFVLSNTDLDGNIPTELGDVVDLKNLSSNTNATQTLKGLTTF